jgi:hypothetical protein
MHMNSARYQVPPSSGLVDVNEYAIKKSNQYETSTFYLNYNFIYEHIIHTYESLLTSDETKVCFW